MSTMVRAVAVIENDVLAEVKESFRTSPKRMRREFPRAVNRSQARVQKVLRQYAPDALPQLPFIWSYDPVKQARAQGWYFANRVPPGSAGGRYNRTGQLMESFAVRQNLADYAGELILENDAPGATFVIGDEQVPSHFLTGWPTIDEFAVQAGDVLTDAVIDSWFAANDL